MTYRFDVQKAAQAMLFVIHCLGGTTDISRLFMILYLADLKHLAKQGGLICGDTYIALKYGPVPFHILGVIKEIRDEHTENSDLAKYGSYFGFNNTSQITARIPYNAAYIAESEAESLFTAIHEYKNTPLEALCASAMGKAWQNADINGEINMADMAIECGATPEMVKYIEVSYKDELNSFNSFV